MNELFVVPSSRPLFHGHPLPLLVHSSTLSSSLKTRHKVQYPDRRRHRVGSAGRLSSCSMAVVRCCLSRLIRSSVCDPVISLRMTEVAFTSFPDATRVAVVVCYSLCTSQANCVGGRNRNIVKVLSWNGQNSVLNYNNINESITLTFV